MDRFDNRRFEDILGSISTSSRLEEKLVAILQQKQLEGVQLSDGELSEQRMHNKTWLYENKFDNWDLSDEEEAEFFKKLVEAIKDDDIKRSKSALIYFKDAGVAIQLKSRRFKENLFFMSIRKDNQF